MRLYKNRRGGFTLVEVLATVAILVILLGLSAVGVAHWRDSLKITELDNAARAIYMAAENRAVLLQNSGVAATRLSSSGSKLPPMDVDGQTVAPVVLSNGDIGDLLPMGMIAPNLRDGQFYILYDENTRHVFEVFYAEESFSGGEATLNALRGESRSDRIQLFREKTIIGSGGETINCLVGYYGGGTAHNIATKPLPTPGVEVEITNGNQLLLKVTYTMPEGLPQKADGTPVPVTRTPEVWLAYDDPADSTQHFKINLLNSARKKGGWAVDNKTAEYTWVLDSLDYKKDDGTTVSRRFKDLFPAGALPQAFGGSFTVTAKLTLSAADDDYLDSSFSAHRTDNSLFYTTSTDDTAKIANLRHLQNLDTVYSGVAKKTTALQLKDIDCKSYTNDNGDVLISEYEFIPIENWDLYSYDARRSDPDEEDKDAVPYTIKNLKITPQSTAANSSSKNTGLFSAVNAQFQFRYVRIINSTIEGWGNVGGIVGSAPGATFTKCSLEEVTVTGWNLVGGLISFWWGTKESDTVTFDQCEAKNLRVTSNNSTAGGLAGGGPRAIFRGCIVGKTRAVDENDKPDVTAKEYAGGLIGNLSGVGSFESCMVFNAEVICKLDEADVDSEAGGLVGRTAGGSRFVSCDASDITVKATMNAGGLVGGAINVKMGFKEDDSPAPCTVENVVVSANNYAGGLVGNSSDSEFFNCKATGATVTAKVDAGGVAGRTQGTNLTNCWVYWDNTVGMTKTDYKVIAGVAGGLVGAVIEGGTIKTSFAATLVKGTSHAGGLVGYLPSPTTASEVEIETSYADCYLKVGPLTGDTAYAGGLVGAKNPGTKLKLTNVYAAGEIDAEGQGAGLCGGWVDPGSKQDLTATNAYAAVRYENVSGGYALICNGEDGCATNCYCLNSPWGNVTSYDTMRNLNMGDAFTKSVETHPYWNAGVYPFPGLVGLPHYGDWPTS